MASSCGLKEIVQILLENVRTQINKQDFEGRTALMWASSKGHKEIVKMLLLHGKSLHLNQQDKHGFTALIMAASAGQKDIVQMLLQEKNLKKKSTQ